MKKIITLVFALAMTAMMFNGCNKEPVLKELVPHLPETSYEYSDQPLTGFGENTPPNNHATNAGATLGRLLFYDPRLSLNNTISCASCHKQEFAFADRTDFTEGFEGKHTLRNSMPIVNLVSKSSFFWDGRETSLEQMVLKPISNHIEMGLDKGAALENKIRSVSYYPELFEKAFGDKDVTYDRIARALAQFLRSLQTADSKFDRGAMNAQEQFGVTTFVKYKCNNCHFGSNFGGSNMMSPYGNETGALNAANIGLDMEYADKGVGALTGRAELNGAFIIPSLRNLKYTAPYMHDGRFATIEQVIEHYNSNIKANPAIDPNLTEAVFNANPSLGSTPVKMGMTAEEKAALAAFLRALSGESITSDVRFSNPFK